MTTDEIFLDDGDVLSSPTDCALAINTQSLLTVFNIITWLLDDLH